MKQALIVLALFISWNLLGQQFSITGHVIDEKAAPLMYATVALMNPADSTLAYFSVTNTEGRFEIKNIKQGKYIMQSAYMGYQTINKMVDVPLKDQGDAGAIVMEPVAVNLKETKVVGERIPILIKGDSIEYNAAAFKTKQDAVVEDLLRKLPGVEVDRAGNIKAQGETVKNVLVDGKEFFGNDPKIATKNLPADAIKKVQVYDKKSDEAELTGIDDGSRNKTINLLLKDGKKKAWIGDLQAGVGTDEHYQASAKAYRFTKKTQFALLGMLNNINQFGFSFQDYIDFNGGFGNFMGGGGGFRLNFNSDNSFPINFGQPVTGLITSGAGGLNYSYEWNPDNRFNISYLGNGADKNLHELTYSKNYINSGSFVQNEDNNQDNSSRAHRINLGWRDKPDSLSNLITSGNISLSNGDNHQRNYSESLMSDTLVNRLNSSNNSSSNGLNASARINYLRKGKNAWKLFKIGGDISGNYSLSKSQWENVTQYFQTNDIIQSQLFQNNQMDVIRYNLSTSLTRSVGKGFYLVPEIAGGGFNEVLDRKQGIPPGNEVVIDSLSPHFTNIYQSIKPALTFKRSTRKTQFSLNAQVELGKHSNGLRNEPTVEQKLFYFTPSLNYEYEYRRSHRYSLNYNSRLNIPNANQLLAVPDNTNPLQLSHGNQHLKPEYIHDLRLNWIVFDEFSFTSIFASINASYTKDKINFARDIDDNLAQSVSLINIKNDYLMEGSFDFSTPIRKVGLTLHATARETWNRGLSMVEGKENVNTNLRHELSLSFDNKKKDKWDVNIGANINLTNAEYSLQKSLNSKYFNYAYFGEINYNPSDKWFISFSAEVTQYNTSGFNQSINIPLLKASVSHYFLKGNRGVLSLEVFDMLNKNSGIERISELNYLLQRKSNIIGRYAMLSFKYRLNKFGGNSDIQINVGR